MVKLRETLLPSVIRSRLWLTFVIAGPLHLNGHGVAHRRKSESFATSCPLGWLLSTIRSHTHANEILAVVVAPKKESNAANRRPSSVVYANSTRVSFAESCLGSKEGLPSSSSSVRSKLCHARSLKIVNLMGNKLINGSGATFSGNCFVRLIIAEWES